MNWTFFWDTLDKIGIAAALMSLLVTVSIRVYLWRKEQRDNDLIYIRLKTETEPVQLITLQGQIRRRNLARAEVLGLLGMLPIRAEGRRYSLAALSHQVFFDELEEAQVNAAVREVVIPCSRAELAQFDEVRLSAVCEISTLQQQDDHC